MNATHLKDIFMPLAGRRDDSERSEKNRTQHWTVALSEMTTENEFTPSGEERAGEPSPEKNAVDATPPVASAEGAPFTGETPAPPTGAAVPEDLRAPWGWVELLLFAGFALASLLALQLILGTFAMAKLRLNLAEFRKFATSNVPFITALQVLWFSGLMLFLGLLIRLRHGMPFWRTIGWRGLRPRAMSRGSATLLCLLGGVGLAIVVSMAGNFVGKKARLPIEALFRDRRSVLLLMAYGLLVAPLVEETIFRGYLYPVFARRLGVPAGVFVTGALFGLAHATQLWGGWGHIALLLLVGVVLTYVRARTGTVLASFFVHLGYNSMLFAGFYFATGGLRRFPVAS